MPGAGVNAPGAGRGAEYTFGRHVRPLTVGTLAFGLFALALLLLTQVHGIWIAALVAHRMALRADLRQRDGH